MRASSGSSSRVSGSQGNQLRLIDCPSCHVQLICIRSKQPDTYDELFFKCPNNVKGDPRTCGFIRSEPQYEAYLRRLDAQKACSKHSCCQFQAAEDAGIMGQICQLKDQIEEMKLQIEGACVDILKLQQQIGELKTWDMRALVVRVLVVIGMLVFWKCSCV